MSATTSAYLVSGGSNSYLVTEALVQLVGREAAQRSNMPETMWVKELVGESTLTAHYREQVAMSATSQTEGNALSIVQWSPTGETVVAGLDGLAIQITTLVNSIAPEVLGEVAFQGGTALARAIDTSACALFSSLTAGTVGTSGTALTVSNVLVANANLDANHADEISPYQGRLHPHQFGNLYQDIMSKNFGIAKITTDAMGKEVINIGETILKKNSLLSKVNSSADWAGGIYCNQALGLAIALNPNVQIFPIPGQATYSVDCTVAFGVGVIRAGLGVLVQSGVSA
jgi:hypothetical protein